MASSVPTSDPLSSPSPSASLPSSVPPTSSPSTSSPTTDPGSSSSSVSPSSSTPPLSSVPPSTTSSSSSSSSIPTTISSSSASSSSVSLVQSLSESTNSNGGVVTFTKISTQTQSAPASTASGAVREASKGFLQNKGAVAAVFTVVGLVAAGLLFALVTNALRRRRAKRFDREIAEEAKRVPAPVFVDDDDDYAGGYSSAAYGGGGGGGGYSDVAGYGAHAQQDPYAASHGPSSDTAYPASDAVHSGGGTPSNYMYPSGYSDLGFSDVSSHGTFAQPPMDAYNAGGGGGGYGGYGGGAGVGAAGAYEMMGYAPQHAQVGQDWHAQGGQVGGGYVYPGEETQHAQGYPPTATTANSSGSEGLGRSKSGARSLVDSYNTPPSEGGSGKGVPGAQPHYADGYVSQYQTHVVEDDGAYGGMESQHGHVLGLEDEESDGEGDGRRVLKVANN